MLVSLIASYFFVVFFEVARLLQLGLSLQRFMWRVRSRHIVAVLQAGYVFRSIDYAFDVHVGSITGKLYLPVWDSFLFFFLARVEEATWVISRHNFDFLFYRERRHVLRSSLTFQLLVILRHSFPQFPLARS